MNHSGNSCLCTKSINQILKHMKKQLFKAMILVAGFSAIFSTSCKKDEETSTPSTPTAKSIYQIAKDDARFSTLAAAIEKAGLQTTLSGTGTFTVFAPTNDAFSKLGLTAAAINAITDPADIEELKNVVLYHALGTKVLSTQLSNGYVPSLFTVSGNGVSIQIGTNPVKINNSINVSTADVSASNGVIHIVDNVLIPPTITDIAINNPNFSTLVGALVKAELDGTFEGEGTFTVFAPINQAFTDISFDLNATDKAALTPILTAHALSTQVRSNQIPNGTPVKTLNEAVSLTFNTSMGVKFSGGKTTDISVQTADIQATNGVVHVINKVILP